MRPYCADFLKEMSLWYEIVIFTTETQEITDPILDSLDKGHVIKHRMYRQHALIVGEIYIKDMRKLGRELEKVVSVDNLGSNFQLQTENNVYMKSWTGKPDDEGLLDLNYLLLGKMYLEIARSQPGDVRRILKHYREVYLGQIANGIDSPRLMSNLPI